MVPVPVLVLPLVVVPVLDPNTGYIPVQAELGYDPDKFPY